MTLSRVLLVDDHDEIGALFQEGLDSQLKQQILGHMSSKSAKSAAA